jgi:hypothetical protein
MAIERRSLVHLNDTLVLGLSNTTARSYQFVITPNNWYQSEVNGFLVDNYLGTQTPISLSGTTVINFNIDGTSASSAPKRFSIVFRPSGIVPVTFSSIKATQQKTAIAVNWNVATQINTKQYVIEKSADGNNFTKAATVAVSGNTYNWIDENPAKGNNYYRIMSVGVDGTTQYSQVVKVNIGTRGTGISVYPNPVTNNVIGLQLNNLASGNYHVRLLNTVGQEMLTKTINHNGGSEAETMPLNKNIAKGSYYLELVSPDNTRTGLKVLIN